MNALTFLERLQSFGASVAVVGDELEIEAPDHVLTAKVLAGIKARRADLLELLRDDAASTCDAGESAVQRDLMNDDPMAARLAVAETFGRLASHFGNRCRFLKSGAVKIDGVRLSYDAALLLAATETGTTSNGYPLEFHPLEVQRFNELLTANATFEIEVMPL